MTRGYIPTSAPAAQPTALNRVVVPTTPPTVTLSAANAATSITGSTLRAPKILSGTTVDIANDPSFVYLGSPSVSYLTGGNSAFVSTPVLTGTTTFERYALSLGFHFYGDVFEVVFKATSATWEYRIRVNGEFVTLHGNRSTTLTVGATYRIVVAFASVDYRLIQVDTIGNAVGGVAAAPAHTVSAARQLADIPTLFVGDSITQGANQGTAAGFSNLDAWATFAAHMLGWRNPWNVALGSTGYIASTAQRAALVDRLADFTRPGSRVVVYAGLNDITFIDTTLPAAIDTVLGAIKNSGPSEFYVVGCHVKNGDFYPFSNFIALNNLLRTKAAKYGAKFVDPFAIRPFTGNGNSTTPNGTGNADLFVNGDNVHPTRAGAQYLGRVYAEAIRGAN